MLTPGSARSTARAVLSGLFRTAGIETADIDARLLVCAACGIDHLAVLRDPDVPIGGAADILNAWATRRLAHEPVSRIVGQRSFWGLVIQVTPDVLDPRPETEGLVASVIDAVGGRNDAPLSILDLGTGSGAILCALLQELPGAFGIALDRSIAACRVASANLGSLGFGARSAVVCGCWTDALAGRFDIIVSNPPYIPSDEVATLERDVRDFDPRIALDGGPDGLAPYRALAPRFETLLRPDGIAGLECGAGQGPSVAALLERSLGDVTILRDLAGHDRVLTGRAMKRPDGDVSGGRSETTWSFS